MYRRALATLVALLPAAALAHTGIGAHGAPFVSGLLHPLLGADHLLTMVAVGLFAAMTGGRARWAYPAAFVGAMMVGGMLGFGGAALPVVEPTILASVVVLGAAIAFALRPPLPLACGVIALFGVAHGYAHGLEGPALGGIGLRRGLRHRDGRRCICLGLGLGFVAGSLGRPVFARALGGLAGLAGVGADPRLRARDDPRRDLPRPRRHHPQRRPRGGHASPSPTPATARSRSARTTTSPRPTRARLRPRRRPRLRLDIPAGTAVRFEPGQTREVRLVPYAGAAAGLRLQRAGHGSRSNDAPSTTPAPASAAPSPSRRRSTSPSRSVCNCSRCQRLGSRARLHAARELHAAPRRGRAHRIHLQPPRDPAPVLPHLRHPDLRLRRRCPTARAMVAINVQLPRRRRSPDAARPPRRRPRVLTRA